MSIETQIIVFYLLLVDASIANIIAWVGRRWYIKHFQIMSRVVPLTKVWAFLYLALVLWVGYLLGAL